MIWVARMISECNSIALLSHLYVDTVLKSIIIIVILLSRIRIALPCLLLMSTDGLPYGGGSQQHLHDSGTAWFALDPNSVFWGTCTFRGGGVVGQTGSSSFLVIWHGFRRSTLLIILIFCFVQ